MQRFSRKRSLASRCQFHQVHGREHQHAAHHQSPCHALATEGDRRPQVWLVDFADSSVNYLLVVWLNEAASRRNTAVMAAYLWELDTALKAHGIEIPFPQRDLNLRSLFGLQGAVALKAMRGEIDIADVQPAAAEELEAALAGQKSAKDALDSAVARGNTMLRTFEKTVK